MCIITGPCRQLWLLQFVYKITMPAVWRKSKKTMANNNGKAQTQNNTGSKFAGQNALSSVGSNNIC